MTATSTCPTFEELQRFLQGHLPAAEGADVERHLGECVRCRETLQTLKKADADTTAAAPGPAANGDPTVGAVPPPGAATEEIFDFLAPAEGADEIGRLGPYRVLKVLGRGGMGLVFQAEDVQLQRLVALKVILPFLAASSAVKQRFLREARAMAAVEHDHIVPIYQVGEERGTPYLAMPLLKGESLDDRLQREGKLPADEALRIGREITEGLTAAHERGLVHRDIKPSNVWLEGKRGRVKVLDFGLARAVEGHAHITQSGVIAGTPAYMAPEQANGEAVDARSDLFSLGCVLYRTTTGEAPFKGASTLAVLRALAVETPRPPRELNPDLPPALSELIVRLLAKDPAGRPASASAVAEALEAIGKGKTPVIPATNHATMTLAPPTPAPAARPRTRRSLPFWAAVAAAALLLSVGGYLFGPAVYRVSTNQGLLVVEVNDPKVEVLLTQQGVKVRDAAKGREYVLKPGARDLPAGDYAIEITEEAGGLRFSTKEFTITRNGITAVKVTLEPAAPALAEAVKVPTPEELAGRPSAADALRREDVPAAALVRAGAGVAEDAPPELVAILGDGRFRLTGMSDFMSYSPDGKLLAVPSWNEVRLFDADTGRLRQTLRGHQDRVARVTFSRDGSLLASACMDGTVKLWDAAGWRELITLRGSDKSWVQGLAFSPDGKTLATGHASSLVEIWDVGTEHPPRAFRGHASDVFALAFHPSGKTLISGANDGTVILWDLSDGKRLQTTRVGTAATPLSAGFSPDGDLLAVGSETTLKVFGVSTDAPPLKELWSAETPSGGLTAFTPDGKTLFTGAHPRQSDLAHTVTRWRAADGKELSTLTTEIRGGWATTTLSPDGKTLADGSDPARVVRLYDAVTGKPRFPDPPGHTSEVLCVAFSPDGKTLASASRDHTVKLWDLTNGKEIHTLRGHTGDVECVAFSPDGRTLASGSDDKTIILWDTAAGRRLHTLSGHTEVVFGVAFSPNGRLVASTSGGGDGSVRLWDVAAAEQAGLFEGHPKGGARGVAFSPDGRTLASAGWDNVVRLWDLETGKEQRAFLRHTAPVKSVAFFPDGRTVASAGDDDAVRVWSCATGVVQRTLTGSANWVESVAVRADGRMVAATGDDGAVRLWDLSEPPRRKTVLLYPTNAPVQTVAFSPEGRYLATANPDGTVYILRLASSGKVADLPSTNTTFTEERRLEPHKYPFVHTVAVSADGREALTSEADAKVVGDQKVHRWDLASGKELGVYEGHPESVWYGAFAPDGRRIFTSCKDGRVRLWDFTAGKEVYSGEGHVGWVTAVALTPDGRYGLSGGNDGTVRLWNGQSGKALKVFAGGHTQAVLAVALSPDGKRALTASRDNTVCLWDAETGKRLQTFPGSTAQRPALCFAPDGVRAAWTGGDGLVHLWDVAAGRELHRLPFGSDSMNAAAFSPDGKRLLAGALNGLLVLWDADTGRVLDRTHSAGVLSVAFTPDGRRALIGHNDGAARVWLLPEPAEDK